MQWFKHDSNANTDDKLQNLLLDYGLEGYGLYWYCLELIVNRVDKDNINFELKHDARIIAKNTGSTVQKVEEMMRYFVTVGLFENNNGYISCLKLLKRMDTSMTSNQFMREIIVKAKNRHDAIMIHHDAVMQEEKRRDDIRTDLKTIDRIDAEFIEFWSVYPKKVGKDIALKSWLKLKPNINEVLKALAWQTESDQWQEKDGKFIPNPATYLNQGRWKDEPKFEGVPF